MSIEEQYGSPVSEVLANWTTEMYFLADGRCVIVNEDGKHSVIEAEDKS